MKRSGECSRCNSGVCDCDVSDECTSNVSMTMKLGDSQPLIRPGRREGNLKWISGELKAN